MQLRQIRKLPTTAMLKPVSPLPGCHTPTEFKVLRMHALSGLQRCNGRPTGKIRFSPCLRRWQDSHSACSEMQCTLAKNLSCLRVRSGTSRIKDHKYVGMQKLHHPTHRIMEFRFIHSCTVIHAKQTNMERASFAHTLSTGAA